MGVSLSHGRRGFYEELAPRGLAAGWGGGRAGTSMGAVSSVGLVYVHQRRRVGPAPWDLLWLPVGLVHGCWSWAGRGGGAATSERGGERSGDFLYLWGACLLASSLFFLELLRGWRLYGLYVLWAHMCNVTMQCKPLMCPSKLRLDEWHTIDMMTNLTAERRYFMKILIQ
jgi:hypothetical protein